MSAIYLHIPFCKRLCGYCDFFKSVKLNRLNDTLDAMEKELTEEYEFLNDHKIETIYFGGGTPSLVGADRIRTLLNIINSNYDTSTLKEITLEANPDDLSAQYLTDLRNAGINRLSIGVQSFNDEVLTFMNRRHNATQAIEMVKLAQSIGFDNITIDLIFGVKGFGIDTLQQSITTALELGVQHISAYHLTIEPGTPFARKAAKGELQSVDEEQSEREYRLIENRLTEAGFEHYEVSNYALPNYRSAHNSSYWHGVEYLGIGPAAHSFNGKERRYAIDSIEEYITGGSERYKSELLNDIEHYNEFIMTSLRCCEGINLEIFNQKFDEKFVAYFLKNAKRWIAKGDLYNVDGHVRIPTTNFLISDLIIESLFWSED
ncbi:MAG: radical SAM family heme chaperone HemW [Rikenellaceae bacterium]